MVRGVHKGHPQKGLKSAVGNYRPVSITSVICKMMESIVRDHIVTHMSSNRLFANKIWLCTEQRMYDQLVISDGRVD